MPFNLCLINGSHGYSPFLQNQYQVRLLCLSDGRSDLHRCCTLHNSQGFHGAACWLNPVDRAESKQSRPCPL
ncbi:hypothetical protein NQZ68_036896 [Dissostichus eleginoides]|nr:hypothetical protein NQZ68_036896 [Dissostichus eleginoides]